MNRLGVALISVLALVAIVACGALDRLAGPPTDIGHNASKTARTSSYDRTTLELAINPYPIARVTCEVAARGGKFRRSVVWDGTISQSPTRMLRVPRSPLAIRCGSEAVPLNSTTEAHELSYRFDPQQLDPGSDAAKTFSGIIIDLVPHGLGQKTSKPDAAAPSDTIITATFNDNAPDTLFGTVDLGAARSFDDTATAALTELLRSLAEIALDKARSRAAAVMSDLLKQQCEQLVVGGKPLFPRTCDALAHLRIDDLAASGDLLLHAVASDLTAEGLALLGKLLHDATNGQANWSDAFVDSLQPLVADLIDGKTDQVERDLRLALLRMARLELPTTTCTRIASDAAAPEPTGTDVVALILDTTLECVLSNGCQESDIVALIDESASCATSDTRTAKVVQDILSVFFPTKNTPIQTVIKNGLDAVLMLFAIAEPKQGEWAPFLTPTRDLVNAIIDANAAAAISAGSKLVEVYLDQWNGVCAQADAGCDIGDAGGRATSTAVRKLTSVLAAIAAYSATYATNSKTDPASVKEQHDARKKALETLIDSNTDRSDAGLNWIVSIGANVGFLAGGQWLHGANYADMPPQLSLSVGPTIQFLPPAKSFGVGFHFQMALLDLAQYVSYYPGDSGLKLAPSVGSVVSLGAQVGFLFGTATDVFFLGTEVRYAPMLFSTANDTAQGLPVLRFGVNLSYYVPFFDFAHTRNLASRTGQ